MSHGLAINPYIYTYIKIETIKPFTYPRFTEIPKIKEILGDTHGMLLWKEQKEEILDYIASLSDEEKENYNMAIKIVLQEIELRSKSLSNHHSSGIEHCSVTSWHTLKAHMPEDFENWRTNSLSATA